MMDARETETGASGWRLADPATVRGVEHWRRLPRRRSRRRHAPENYQASTALLDAMDTAISVGQPLVLTGEPGVGKTAFAEHVAWLLGLPEFQPDRRVLRSDVKSTMQGRDLLYRYDALDHFNAAHIRKETVDARDFVAFEALGEAILRTRAPADVEALIGRRLARHDGPIRSVVLIDEIDKAPRDLPNDLLREFDEMTFNVPELGRNTEIRGDLELRPIVIVTSNRETRLPDAFMRRCCFFYIPFPDADADADADNQLRRIVAERIDEMPEDGDLVGDAIALLREVRRLREGRGRPPGIAELLAYVEDLESRGYGARDRLVNSGRQDWQASAARVFLEGDQDDDARIAQAAAAMARHGAGG